LSYHSTIGSRVIKKKKKDLNALVVFGEERELEVGCLLPDQRVLQNLSQVIEKWFQSKTFWQ